MASHLKKDPYTYEREHNAFVRELRQFHDSRGTPFRHPPRINGREVDLCCLYNEVTARGGWHKVNDTRNWDAVLQPLHIPWCPNATVALKHVYIRYLDQYEKIHFHGEDPDDDRTETLDSRGRKIQTASSQIPMTYNHQQHELSDVVRVQLGLSQDTVSPTEYDKLVFSLLSGLPNEVDFAINMCTLLSNEGHHVLRLERCPRLLELLIAHAGVWSDTNVTLRGLLEESWSKVAGRRMSEFWEDSIEDLEIRELLGPWEGKSKEVVEEDRNIFNLSRDVGIRDSEGQRVLQIAAILRNLAFEESNISVLASSPVCLKFLLLCAHNKWSNLKQLGLDTLGSLCSEMVLDPYDDISTQLIFRTITRNLQSDDRFLVIRSLEMLIGLCQVEGNEDVLVKSLNNRVYEQVCAFLTIQDIMLLVYTLESLYNITLLGAETCTFISRLHGVIGILVGLISVDAQNYGSDACLGMKVVENSAPAVQPVASTPPTQHKSLPTAYTSHSHRASAIPIPVGYQELDNETFACNWLKATYEISTARSVAHSDIYNEYQNVCIKLGKKGLIGPTQLANYVRSVFPHVMPRRVDGSSSDVFMDGIRKRVHTLPVSIIAPIKSCNVSSAAQRTPGQLTSSPVISIPSSPSQPLSPSSSAGHSPILKAQLSAPPRSPSSNHHPHLQQALLSRPSPPSSPVTPSKESSTLIKSLLANKVNQNIQRQQLLKQQKGASSAPVSCVSQTASSCINSVSSSSVPLTLEACLAIPVTNTNTLLTTTSRNVLGSAITATTTTTPTSTKLRTNNSQLGAMLGHCDPPPPLPPPRLTKELFAAQAAIKAKKADTLCNALSPTVHSISITNPPVPSLPSPKMPQKVRINGAQRIIMPDMCAKGESLEGCVGNHVPKSIVASGCSENRTNNVELSSSEVKESGNVSKAILLPSTQFRSVVTESGIILAKENFQTKDSGLKLQNGSQAPVSTQVITTLVVTQITSTAALNTASTTITNAPSVFKSHDLASAQSSGTSQFSNLPSSLQSPQPSKRKGVLADLLDGKVHSDSLLTMNGIIDRSDKKTCFTTNHQGEASAINPSKNTNSIPQSTAVVTGRLPAAVPIIPNPALIAPKNFNMTNGESVGHLSTSPMAVSPSLIPVASVDGDKTNVRHIGNPNGCGKVATLILQPGANLPKHNALKEVSCVTTAVTATVVANPTPSTSEINSKCSPVLSTGMRTAANNRFPIVSSPKTEELIGFPRVSMEQLKQLRQQGAGTMRFITKRPSTDFSDSVSDSAKRVRVDNIAICHPSNTAIASPPATSPSVPSSPVPIAPKPTISCSLPLVTTTTTAVAPLNASPIMLASGGSCIATFKGDIKLNMVNKFKVVPASSVVVQKVRTILPSIPDAGKTGQVQGTDQKCAMEESPLAKLTVQKISETNSVNIGGGNNNSSNNTNVNINSSSINSTSTINSNNSSEDAKTAPAALPPPPPPPLQPPPPPPLPPPPPPPPPPKLEYMCEWKGCKKIFESPTSVFFHACKVHAPKGSTSIPCLWENCDQMARQRLSLMTHLQDRHCNENVLRLQATRRHDLLRAGSSAIPIPTPPPPHPGYAPNAALHAIKRHALEFLNAKEYTDENEGPVTKSIRFTAALILRNLIMNSSQGRSVAKQYEGYLATIAFTNSDSSRTIAYCLAELGKHSNHMDNS